MSITVYNKTYLYVGFVLASIGGYLDDEKIIPIYLGLSITIVGTALMLLSMKKPKQTESEEL